MTNHERLKEIVHARRLKDFTYETIKNIADNELTCTTGGKYFATLKFLQQFCNPINVSEEEARNFKAGDPREFVKRNSDIKISWLFSMNLSKSDIDGSIQKTAIPNHIAYRLDMKIKFTELQNLIKNLQEFISKGGLTGAVILDATQTLKDIGYGYDNYIFPLLVNRLQVKGCLLLITN